MPSPGLIRALTRLASASASPSALVTSLNPPRRARRAVASPTVSTGNTRTTAGNASTALPLGSKTAAIRAETDAKIKPILTAEQWTKLQELRAERKAQGKDDAKKKK